MSALAILECSVARQLTVCILTKDFSLFSRSFDPNVLDVVVRLTKAGCVAQDDLVACKVE